MKKTLIVLGCMSLGLAHAQQGREHTQHQDPQQRVGINTDKPVATLELKKTNVATGQVEGFMLPHLTQAERNAMTQDALVSGLQIFNTTKKCIEWWNGRYWQCTDGTKRDNHGDAPAFTAEKTWLPTSNITFYKTDCEPGKQATPTAQFVFDPNSVPADLTALLANAKGEGQGNTQGEADDRATEDAKAKFYKVVQEYVNGKFGNASSCVAAPTKDPDRGVVITGGKVALENRTYWFSAIDDKDYLPLKPYTGPATLDPVTADGVETGFDENDPINKNEPHIYSEAKIPTLANAIQVYIPIKLTEGSSVNLSEHIVHIEIPAKYTADNRAGVATFTWNPVTINSGTRFIPAKFYAQEEIKLKGLDLIGGLGDDLGMVIGTFKYPKTQAETTAEQWTGKYELRLISGILDQNFTHKSQLNNKEDYRHRFIYVPVQGPDGKIWFNNNLGADYANVRKTVFNPGQQAKAYNDHHAYGNLGQWGRTYSGRELMNWTGPATGTPVFKDEPGYNWTSDESHLLPNYIEHCPTGWHTPTQAEFQAHATANTGTVTYPTGTASANQIQQLGFYQHGLRVPLAGIRYNSYGSTLFYQGSTSYLWSSTPLSSNYAYFLNSTTGSVTVTLSDRSNGFGVRCLKD